MPYLVSNSRTTRAHAPHLSPWTAPSPTPLPLGLSVTHVQYLPSNIRFMSTLTVLKLQNNDLQVQAQSHDPCGPFYTLHIVTHVVQRLAGTSTSDGGGAGARGISPTFHAAPHHRVSDLTRCTTRFRPCHPSYRKWRRSRSSTLHHSPPGSLPHPHPAPLPLGRSLPKKVIDVTNNFNLNMIPNSSKGAPCGLPAGNCGV